MAHLTVIPNAENVNTNKGIQKTSKIFKPSLHDGISTATNIENVASLMGCVRFFWPCGKMCSHYLFSYKGFSKA